jgi:gamma-glutamyltranspeptidase/glutathione hydrolase
MRPACRALLLVLLLPLLAWSQAAAPRYDLADAIFHPVTARHGMVASDHRLASEVGVAILRRGGNAVDAAVAVGFTLAVVLPTAGNLGGGGFMVIHDAKSGRDIALDFREMAPAAATRDMYLDAAGQVVPGRSLDTPLAVGVPGSVAGLTHALARYGTLPLRAVLAPAIRLARQGFPVSDDLAAMLAEQRDRLGAWPASRAVFFRAGRPLRAGERLVQRDLARSLELIANRGARAFYDGEIGRRIVAAQAGDGGLMRMDDLRRYRVVERAPVVGNYRGYRVVSMPPPSSGGTHIVEMLNILERYPLADYGPGSARTLHLEAEAMKLAYADRAEWLGDPDFTKVPVAGLTARAYADQLAQGIDAEHARPAAEIRPGRPQPYESEQTTHYSVADEHGNAVATTYTLNMPFGSGIVAAGTGILLNDEMDDFAAKPGVANAFGLVGGDANAVAAGKRPLSSMSPTILEKEGRPWLVTGSPGGSRIITTVLQTIIDSVDFAMNPAEAAAAPRIHHQWTPDELRVERGISPDTLDLLRQRGQHVVVGPAMGRSQTIRIDAGGFAGYSDPRSPDAATLGY